MDFAPLGRCSSWVLMDFTFLEKQRFKDHAAHQNTLASEM